MSNKSVQVNDGVVGIEFPGTFVCLDLETTGLRSDEDRIVEVAAVRYEGGQKVGELSQVVDPGVSIPFLVQAITNISDEMVKGKPKFSEIREEVREFIGDAPLLGQNIQFDIGFLRANGIDVGEQWYDTRSMASMFMPDASAMNLEVLAMELGFVYEDAHRALADVEMTVNVFDKLYQRLCAMSEQEKRVVRTFLVGKESWHMGEVFEFGIGEVEPDEPGATEKDWVNWFRGEIESAREGRGGGDVVEDVGDDAGLTEAQQEVVRALVKAKQDGATVLFDIELPVEQRVAGLFASLLDGGAGENERVVFGVPRSQMGLVAGRDMKRLAGLVERMGDDERASKAARSLDEVALIGQQRDYVCVSSFVKFARRSRLSGPEVEAIVKFALWQLRTRDGLVGELYLTRDDYRVIDKICRVRAVPGESYWYELALERARTARVMVCDHAYVVGESRRDGEVMSGHLVLHDIHEFEETAGRVMSRRLSIEGIDQVLALLDGEGVLRLIQDSDAGSAGDTEELVAELVARVGGVRDSLALRFGILGMVAKSEVEGNSPYVQRFGVGEAVRGLPVWARAAQAFGKLHGELTDLIDGVERLVDDIGDGAGAEVQRQLDVARQELVRIAELVRVMFVERLDDGVLVGSLSPEGDVELDLEMVSVAEVLQKYVYSRFESVVGMSSITTGEKMWGFLQDRLGLRKAVVEGVGGGGVKYQAAFIDDFPDVRDGDFHDELAEFVERLVREVDGRTLVIFPSRSLLERAYEGVYKRLSGDYAVYADGVIGSTRKMVEKFRSDPKGVLMGSSSFWSRVRTEGLDVKAVVIVRLPFPFPHEPVFKARSDRYDRSFVQYSVPVAVNRFRVGVEQLFASEAEGGVVAVLDKRVGQGYGEDFVHAVAPAKASRISTEEFFGLL